MGRVRGQAVLVIMHGRSRMTIDPSILDNAGTEHVEFLASRQTVLATSANCRGGAGHRRCLSP